MGWMETTELQSSPLKMEGVVSQQYYPTPPKLQTCSQIYPHRFPLVYAGPLSNSLWCNECSLCSARGTWAGAPARCHPCPLVELPLKTPPDCLQKCSGCRFPPFRRLAGCSLGPRGLGLLAPLQAFLSPGLSYGGPFRGEAGVAGPGALELCLQSQNIWPGFQLI